MPTRLPVVQTCQVRDCAYNDGNNCHAAAITVGDADHPMCDTFMRAPMKGGVPENGAVGACRVSDCQFNQSLECTASGIDVGLHQDHADCHTFARR